jgi:serine O-acetyltransferase
MTTDHTDDAAPNGPAGGTAATAGEPMAAEERSASRPAFREAGPEPGFVETLLADIEWSGGPVDVADDHDPEGWRSKRLEPKRLLTCLTHLGFYSTVLYRVSRWCSRRGLTAVAAPIQMVNHSLTGAEISHRAEIGPGLRICHPSGVFVGPHVKLGFRSTLNQGTAVSSNIDISDGTPVVGNYLYMSPGAKIMGKLTIGDRVWVGPNSVALRDIEDDKVVLGVPGRAMPPTFRMP